MTAKEAMEQLAAGSDEALDVILYELGYLNKAYRLARRQTKNHHDAEGLSWEVALAVWGARTSYDPGQEFDPYFNAIVRNRLAKYYERRERNRQRRAALEANAEALAPSADDPTAAVEGREQADRAVRLLSERERHVLACRLDGQSIVEIAEAQGVSRGAVDSILKRLRQKLRKALE